MKFCFVKLKQSFCHAGQGIKEAFKQQNFRLMFFMAVLVLFLSFLFKISFWEWLIIVLLIGLVLVLEILNTAIEKLLNFVSPGLSDQARVIKDLSASAVLIICLFSSIIGLLIFLPKLIFLF